MLTYHLTCDSSLFLDLFQLLLGYRFVDQIVPSILFDLLEKEGGEGNEVVKHQDDIGVVHLVKNSQHTAKWFLFTN